MPTLWTIGHSTHPISEFIAWLKGHHIQQLVDIRTIPKSRHNPQFEQDTLAASLAEAGIGYTYLKALGGLRGNAKGVSENTGWRNSSFRNYADYMQSPEFSAGIEQLMTLALAKPTAIMCAEAVPWRCHRSLVADALLIRGIDVLHIMGPSTANPHHLTPFAHVEGLTLTYPG